MDLQEICSVVKFAPEGGIRGEVSSGSPSFSFSAYDSFDTNRRNDLQTISNRVNITHQSK
jgi:hypothetical protein